MEYNVTKNLKGGGALNYFIYIIIAIAVIALLFGLKDIIYMLMWSWGENGKLLTLYVLFLIVLIFLPATTKSYAPKYHDASVIGLMLYVVLFFVLRLMGKFKHD